MAEEGEPSKDRNSDSNQAINGTDQRLSTTPVDVLRRAIRLTRRRVRASCRRLKHRGESRSSSPSRDDRGGATLQPVVSARGRRLCGEQQRGRGEVLAAASFRASGMSNGVGGAVRLQTASWAVPPVCGSRRVEAGA